MKLQVVKLRPLWYLISGALLVCSFIFLASWNLKQGIEFTGGTLMAVHFEGERPSVADTQSVLGSINEDMGKVVIQPAGDADMQLRLQPISEDTHQNILAALNEKYGTVTELRYDGIGPVIGKELRSKSIRGLVIVLLAILIYVAYAFRKVSAPVRSWKYGLVTIIAAFHDVIVPVGVFAYLGHAYGTEIGTPFIAAILTILGYSITDTIVVMDRIRENLLRTSATFSEIVEASVHQTFLRSLNTSMTTLLVLIAIFLYGGTTLREFTLTLIIGISVGTYSSIFIASPLLVSLEKLSKRRKK